MILMSTCCLAKAMAGGPLDGQQKVELGLIGLSKDGRHFVHSGSGLPFKVWGLNYDHDASNRLLEDYWKEEWNAVVDHFRQMKELGANAVRIHLQLGKFMTSPQEPDQGSLEQLSRLLKLAEDTGLYLDITGLGCYRKEDVPQWYNELEEARRWEVQARFWEAVAEKCKSSPAVFCYDLINEPIVTEDKTGRDWLPGAFGDRYFVQRITLDFAGRTQQEIARSWVDQMVAAIRKRDRRHLITVGAIPWALTWPGAKPLFYSKEVSQNLDFVSIHFYPKKGEVEKALTALSVYDIGKSLVIEEMFPLSCSVTELDQFVDGSRKVASGWFGFYWGKPIAAYQKEKSSPSETLTLDWLKYFSVKAPQMSTSH